MNDLYKIAIGIEAIEATRTIAMGSWCGFNANAIRNKELVPGIDIVGFPNDKTQVV